MADRLSKVLAQLEALPPGSLVPRDWLLKQVAEEASDESTPRPAVDLTVQDLAVLFGKRPSTLRAWIERGAFPGSYKLFGKQWRVPSSAVEAFQQAQRSGRDRPGERLSDWRRQHPDHR